MPTPPEKPIVPSTTRSLRCVRWLKRESVYQRSGWYHSMSMPLRCMKSISDCDIGAEPTASRMTFTAPRARALRQRLGEEPPDLAVPVDVELEVDRLPRAADRREH